MNILAIDPGSQKCGLAVVTVQGKVLSKMVISSEDFCRVVTDLLEKYYVDLVVLGNRTRSKHFKESLNQFGLPVVMIEEDKSSIEGRIRYLQENTHGLKRFIPLGLRTPDKPFDDYVAVILAERYLKRNGYLNNPGSFENK